MAKILFFNPPLKNIYHNTNIGAATLSYPSLSLATLAGHLIKEHETKIVDLDLFNDAHRSLFDEISCFKPDIIASTATTPDYFIVRDIMREIKKRYPSLKTVIGGVHVTTMAEEAGREDCFDVIAIGEGDTIIGELLSAPIESISGLIYKDKSGKRIRAAARKHTSNLNELPYPAWHLFDVKKYKNTRLLSRRNPVAFIETSRGCAFQCNFCNKLTFGSEYRTKDPKRAVDEMEYMLKCGFREIHIADDSFTQNIDRAKEICEEIIKRNLKFPWSLLNGVRVNKVDFEFFKLARKAGCWQAGFGIESGDQNVLDKINKKATLSQAVNAVKLANEAGIETFGFFIFALSGETEESMEKTIAFAKSLPLDIAKFDICIPYPGTPYYNELKQEGRIRTEDWSKYNCHQVDEPLFDHPNLGWSTIEAYYKRAFREFYLRPTYVIKRLIRSLRRGDLLHDFYYILKARW